MGINKEEKENSISIENPYIHGSNIFKPFEEKDQHFSFYVNNNEMIKLCGNGDIYVKGEKVENNLEVVKAMKEMLGVK